VAQVFAGRYPGETAGLVLVDPAHPEDWIAPSPDDLARIARGVRLCAHGARAARWGLAGVVARLVALGALAPARALVRLVSGGRLARRDEVILAPMWKLPERERHVLPSFWTQPRFYEALGSQIAHVSESAADVLEARAGGFGDLPLTVISPDGLPDDRRRRQDALAGLSTRGRHVTAGTPGHWVPLDDPDTVARAVLDVVREAAGPGMVYNSG
jgi:pimeloyl-ACP methyl ester carboxylesterase